MLSDRTRISRSRLRPPSRERTVQLRSQILTIVRAAQAAEGDEIIEQHLAGDRANAEQPGRLIQVKGESRHLAERADHHAEELRAAGFGDSAPGLLPPLS